MKRIACSLATVALLTLIATSGCKKSGSRTTSCTTTIYGYNAHLISGTLVADSTTSVGIINSGTALLSGTATVINSVYATKAAFNNADNSYYTFRSIYGLGAGNGALYKINGGTVSTITGPLYVSGLTYDRVNGKFYCIADTSNKLAELIISGSTYTLTNFVSPVHPFYGIYNGETMTQDDNTGAIYYVTGDTSTQYIEKYVPGGGVSVVATISGGWAVLGLCFVKSSNMLYAIKELSAPTYGFDLIKIDPSTGTSATLTAISPGINPEFYSACVDQCSSKYIVSNWKGTDSTEVTQYDMSGTVVQHNVVPGIYQGLSVNY